jgi:putative restriction endonuclease
MADRKGLQAVAETHAFSEDIDAMLSAAAHIRPYGEGGSHTKSNGILLRKDIHCVFDAGYATVDRDYRFVVSNKVKEVFNNGDEYRRLHGKGLLLPASRSDWPDPEGLRWHNDNKFLG